MATTGPSTVAVVAVHGVSGDPRIHRAACGGWQTESDQAGMGSSRFTVRTLTELAIRLYGDAIGKAAGLTAEDFADCLSLAPCARGIPHGAPDAERRFTGARREQGFRSAGQLRAVMDYADHARSCVECPPPGPTVLTGGFTSTAELCDAGFDLYAAALAAPEARRGCTIFHRVVLFANIGDVEVARESDPPGGPTDPAWRTPAPASLQAPRPTSLLALERPGSLEMTRWTLTPLPCSTHPRPSRSSCCAPTRTSGATAS